MFKLLSHRRHIGPCQATKGVVLEKNVGNFHVIIAVITWKSYVCTAVEETNIESIIAVMSTTELVVEIRPEKNSGPYGIWTHGLCDTGLNLFLGLISGSILYSLSCNVTINRRVSSPNFSSFYTFLFKGIIDVYWREGGEVWWNFFFVWYVPLINYFYAFPCVLNLKFRYLPPLHILTSTRRQRPFASVCGSLGLNNTYRALTGFFKFILATKSPSSIAPQNAWKKETSEKLYCRAGLKKAGE